MWLFCLGIFLGIGIYWTIAIILVNRVLDRHIDSAAYLPMLWSSKYQSINSNKHNAFNRYCPVVLKPIFKEALATIVNKASILAHSLKSTEIMRQVIR